MYSYVNQVELQSQKSRTRHSSTNTSSYLPTSETRPYDIASVVVPTLDNVPGLLYLGPAPGKKDKKWNRNLDIDMKVIKELDIDVVVCMLEWAEMSFLQIPDYPHVMQHNNFHFYHAPTIDHTAPILADIVVIVPIIARYLLNGKNVLVHCRGGMGRAATICACVLIYLHRLYGFDVDEYTGSDAVRDVRMVRPKAMKNKEQVEMVHLYADLVDKL